jgi:hypothetical protein
MADLSQTPVNVQLAGGGVSLRTVQVGETTTQGQPMYLKSSDNKYWRADADAEASATARGIALTPGAANDYIVLATAGDVDLGATLTVGETYCVSTNVGAIAPIGDLTTGDYVSILGTATAADTLDLDIRNSGIAKP